MLTTFVIHLLGILFVKGLFKSFAPPHLFLKTGMTVSCIYL